MLLYIPRWSNILQQPDMHISMSISIFLSQVDTHEQYTMQVPLGLEPADNEEVSILQRLNNS